MNESILNSLKEAIGIVKDDDSFDTILVMHINTIFAILHQLGVGPDEGFVIHSDADTWRDYIDYDGAEVEMVRTFMTHKLRLIFDPPTSGAVKEATDKIINELEWRLTNRETW